MNIFRILLNKFAVQLGGLAIKNLSIDHLFVANSAVLAIACMMLLT